MAKKSPISHPVIRKLVSQYRTIWALYHYLSLGEWDIETYLPIKGIKARSEAAAKIKTLSQQLFLDNDFKQLIHRAKETPDLNIYEKGIVRILGRELDYYEKIPARFIEDFSRATNQAQVVWRKAKNENKFTLFQPHLEKIVQLSRKQAEYLGYKNHPYDPLIDLFEEGWNTHDLDNFFDDFRQPLRNLFHDILKKKSYRGHNPLEKLPYDRAQLKKLHHKVLHHFQTKNKGIRLDESAHPFTQQMAVHDVRITTAYHPVDFRQSLLAVVHEFGHALYDMQCDDQLEFSPIAGGLSLGIHESQSRFWENMVGRSRTFIELFAVDFAGLSPEIRTYLKNKDVVDELHHYFNLVRPSLIRTEADEVTYHFHIMLRFEIEKGLIEGSIKTKELPAFWQSKMKEYLGITPQNDAKGVLQDIHWSMGSIGYFPTYSIGTFMSAIWRQEIEKKLGDLEQLVGREKGIADIQQWLKTHIHQYGSAYDMKHLLQVNGRKMGSKPMLDYLKKKYEV